MNYRLQGENVLLGIGSKFGGLLLSAAIQTRLDRDELTPQEREAMELWYKMVIDFNSTPIMWIENPFVISMQLDKE